MPTTSVGEFARTDSLLDLVHAVDPELCGGKAAGLARLARAGFPVPAGICLTSTLYRDVVLRRSGLGAHLGHVLASPAVADAGLRRELLAEIRRRMQTATVSGPVAEILRGALTRLRPNGKLAVRSSALFEDGARASHAGIHVSLFGNDDAEAVAGLVTACWASLWTEAAWLYRERSGITHTEAAMAVIVQQLVEASHSGVAFSADPVTGDRSTLVIEAAPGVGTPLGSVTPDHYRLTMVDGAPPVLRSTVAARGAPALSEAQAIELAGLARAVEPALGVPVDVEWAFDGQTFWLVQARPIVTAGVADGTLWTRANLKEVFPDQPSMLALSYLEIALNRMFRAYHTSQGYELPSDVRLVDTFRGRPYLNLSMMQHMTVIRGGDPRIVSRLFGGSAPASAPPPAGGPPVDRVRLAREMLTTIFLTPRRARRLFRELRQRAQVERTVRLEAIDDAELCDHIVSFSTSLLDEVPLRRLHEIVSAQSRAYMVLERLLAEWIPSGAEELLTRLMTGLGTLPNARMTYRLMTLGALARTEEPVRAFFAEELDADLIRQYRARLAGTRFLTGLGAFLRDFGHRGPLESDVASPRFADDPGLVLRLIQLYAQTETLENPARHAAERAAIRRSAQREVRHALRQGRRWSAFALCWTAVSIVSAALQKLIALRDENRHVTTLMATHLRRAAREVGLRAVRQGLLASVDDVFLLRLQELPQILIERRRDWRRLVEQRARERAHDATLPAPDVRRGVTAVDESALDTDSHESDRLAGLGASPGRVTGTVRILRTASDARALSGEIVVLPALEPTLTLLFPLVKGVVAEMGGVLSHAAILAREYGLPAVVNVPGATERLRDGDLVEMDGASGWIRRLGPATDGRPVAISHDQRRDDEPEEGAGDDVGDIMPAEVHSTQRDGRGQPEERPA